MFALKIFNEHTRYEYPTNDHTKLSSDERNRKFEIQFILMYYENSGNILQ